jgi:hypothetical protein
MSWRDIGAEIGSVAGRQKSRPSQGGDRHEEEQAALALLPVALTQALKQHCRAGPQANKKAGSARPRLQEIGEHGVYNFSDRSSVLIFLTDAALKAPIWCLRQSRSIIQVHNAEVCLVGSPVGVSVGYSGLCG